MLNLALNEHRALFVSFGLKKNRFRKTPFRNISDRAIFSIAQLIQRAIGYVEV